MKPSHTDLSKLGPDYDWVASPVWPGYMIMHVYRHWKTGVHWAINEHMDDDTGRIVGDWYEVVSETTISYRKKAAGER